MIDFVIEKNVPPPARQPGRGGSSLSYRWDLLKINDSVVVPTINAGRNARSWAARNGCVFLTEKQKRGKRGWRVWRIA